NRLYCNWSGDHSVASFAWGNSNTYSRYFQDYQRYIERPLTVAKKVGADSDTNVLIVSLDISAFFDDIDIGLLITKIKTASQQFYEKHGDGQQPADDEFWEAAQRALSFKWRTEDLQLGHLFRDQTLPIGLPQGMVSSGFFANAYLMDFDAEVGSYIDRRPRGKSFWVHDYCRYVDDIKLVVSVDTEDDAPCDIARLKDEVCSWVQSILKKHTSPRGPEGNYLRLNSKKTQDRK